MFLKMFKSGRVKVTKSGPAAVALTDLPRQHPFNGLFAVKAQKTYAGRQAFIADIKTLDKPAAATPKPVKAKPRIDTNMVKLRAACAELLVNAERLKEATIVQKALSGAPTPPKPARTPKQEIEHLTHLIATANTEHEISALRQKLDAVCAEHDKQERAAVREGIQKSAQASELTLLRNFLVGSGIECRRGI